MVAVDAVHEAAFVEAMNSKANAIKTELKTMEPQLEVIISATDAPEKIMDLGIQEGLLRALYATLNGVYRMSADIEGLVETSNN